MARSLKMINAEVLGVSHRKFHPHNYSRLVKRIWRLKANRSSAEWALTVASLAADLGVDLVMPVDFIDVYTFSRWNIFFKDRNVKLAAPSYESVSRASRKDKLPKLLEGIAKTPKQVVIKKPIDTKYLTRLKPPIVIKGLGDASKPEYFLDYEEAAKNAVSRAPCLVQEYVPGIARGYYTVAYRGRPLLEFTHERIIEYDPSGGASLAARGPVLEPNLYRLGRSIVSFLEWTGPLMVETKWCAERDEYLVIELNPKFWGSLHLPVSLGFQFPAVLALAYLRDPNVASSLATKLTIRKGEYYWLVDGLRYLAKLPETWIFMAAKSVREKAFSDVDFTDPARLLGQISVGLYKLRGEKKRWVRSLARDIGRVRAWIRGLVHRIRASSKKPLLIFDLDSTLLSLKIDWERLRRRMIELGYARRQDKIRTLLYKLWMKNREEYLKVSKLIEDYEIKAARSAGSLVDVKMFQNLKDQSPMCIATLQAERSAVKALERIGLKNVFDLIVGRDSGYGPLKEEMFRACLQKMGYRIEDPVVAFEDNLANAIAAVRLGILSVHVARNGYKQVQAIRLGIPSIFNEEIPELVTLIIKAGICAPRVTKLG